MPPPPRPAVLVFDVNETLIDIESMKPHFERIFGVPGVLREWFGQLVTYSMTITLSGYYVDFFTLGQAVLRMTADAHRVDISEDDLAELVDGMLAMPPHRDVAEGLGRLREQGHRLVTLTNSPPNPRGPTALQRAGLAHFFERQFSVHPARVYKPSRQLYRDVAAELSVPTSGAMMVAAHAWDLIGAQAAGLSGALITRPGKAALPAPGIPRPTLVAADLLEFAHQLADPKQH
jgi:2-haloacid dehalogenase